MDNREMLEELLERARAGKHTEFKFLRTWREYSEMKITRKALKIAVKGIKRASNNTFDRYCREVKTGSADIMTLLVAVTLLNTLDFYNKELEIVNKMIFEYEAFLRSNSVIKAVFGEQRSEALLWDHRGLD